MLQVEWKRWRAVAGDTWGRTDVLERPRSWTCGAVLCPSHAALLAHSQMPQTCSCLQAFALTFLFQQCSCPKEPHDLFSAAQVLSPMSLHLRETVLEHTNYKSTPCSQSSGSPHSAVFVSAALSYYTTYTCSCICPQSNVNTLDT